MDAVFKKLNYKGQPVVVVLNAPESFNTNLESIIIDDNAEIIHDLTEAEHIDFVLFFTTKQAELDDLTPKIAKKFIGDAIFWVCYPKKSSKKYTCDFNMMTGWQVMGDCGFEPVRSVAIDDDWTALRFRKTEFIKIMKRKSHALSEAGKERIKDNL